MQYLLQFVKAVVFRGAVLTTEHTAVFLRSERKENQEDYLLFSESYVK